ncbi:pyrroline-5-carboxylate reductase [Priestia megaterium]|uniref:pyrroline-5-carboxylate reductase n=1 Tax=Priestia megaterium TaxID=1404 RepID=UPI003F80E674
MLKDKVIAFMGAGSLAEAMIAGIIEGKIVLPRNILVTNKSDKERLKTLQLKYGVQAINSESLSQQNIDYLVIAMKPKDIDAALNNIKQWISPNTVILSVIAGIKTKYIEEQILQEQEVIRVMPNTSSMIRESATAISPGKYVPMYKVQFIKTLFTSIGQVYIIEEDQMDIFTGIAGSGPAYFYYLLEHLEKAGLEAGLDSNLARDISIQTMYGASKMLKFTDHSPKQLRENVTSPNGTTHAGLEKLNQCGGGDAIRLAAKAAAARSKEIR